MTRATAEAELESATKELLLIRRRMEEAAATGYVDRDSALALAGEAEAARGRIWHLQRELRKLLGRSP